MRAGADWPQPASQLVLVFRLVGTKVAEELLGAVACLPQSPERGSLWVIQHDVLHQARVNASMSLPMDESGIEEVLAIIGAFAWRLNLRTRISC